MWTWATPLAGVLDESKIGMALRDVGDGFFATKHAGSANREGIAPSVKAAAGSVCLPLAVRQYDHHLW